MPKEGHTGFNIIVASVSWDGGEFILPVEMAGEATGRNEKNYENSGNSGQKVRPGRI
jgi:hypothetical protein